ncbi:DUF4189 domain-containing protein [Mycobacterium florentinum]
MYVAIASAQPDGWGWATSDVSQDDAVAKAVGKCKQSNPAIPCFWNAWSRNGCVAIAKGRDGTIWGANGSTRVDAQNNASNKSGGGRVLAWACA